jgi:hypothetical protein
MPARPWHRQHEGGSHDSHRRRKHGQKQIVRPSAEARPRASPVLGR